MTEIEELLKKEIEKEKEFSLKLQHQLSQSQNSYEKSLRELKTEYLNSIKKIHQTYEDTLKKIANQYTKKLEELCMSEESDEVLENDLEMRLTKLERDLSNLRTEFSELEKILLRE